MRTNKIQKLGRVVLKWIFMCFISLGSVVNIANSQAKIDEQVITNNELNKKAEQINKLGQAVKTESKITLASQTSIRLELTFAPPIDSKGALIKTIESPATIDKSVVVGARLTNFVRDLSIEANNLTIEKVEQYQIDYTENIFTDKDIAKANPEMYPKEWATIGYGGIMGKLPISSLVINPYRYNSKTKTILYAKKITILVNSQKPIDARFYANPELGSQYELFANEKLNRPKAMATKPRLTIADDGYEYKFFVNRDGVYRVTAKELQDIGIQIEAINTKNLKLYSQGAEIPIYVDDKGDGSLNTSTKDYIEFFGEQYRPKDRGINNDIRTSTYTKFNVYFLVWSEGQGKRIIDEAAEIRKRSIDSVSTIAVVDLFSQEFAFTSYLHFEENILTANKFENSNLNSYSDDNDRYMWYKVEKGSQAMIEANLPHPKAEGEDSIKVWLGLRGGSTTGEHYRSYPPKAKHKVKCFVGTREKNYPILNASFVGDQPFLTSSDTNKSFVNNNVTKVTSGVLNPNGMSSIVVGNEPVDTASIESFFVNWIDIAYQRKYMAYNDTLTFSTPANSGSKYYNFKVRNFVSPNIRIYRKGISRLINIDIQSMQGLADTALPKFEITFQAYSANDRELFYATTDETILKPIIQKDTARFLESSENEFNYVIIVDDSTSDYANISNPDHPLNKFIEYKGRKFKINVVRATDIYDEFSNGIVTPVAIRKFIENGYNNWRMPLKYVLIASSGFPLFPEKELNFDLRDLKSERSYVPSIYLQTMEFGSTTCDYLYGCITGKIVVPQASFGLFSPRKYVEFNDFAAEVFVGRISAGSLEGIKNYVEKYIQQDKIQNLEAWHGKTIFVVGQEQNGGGEFELDVRNILDVAEADNYSEPIRFFTDTTKKRSDRFPKNEGFIDYLNSESASIVAYLGHGGGGQWQDGKNLLSPTRVRDLRNANKMPAILSFSCFTGNYTSDPDQGMMTALMTQAQTGALNGLGAAGFSYQKNNAFFATAFFTALNNPNYRNLPFAQVVAIAKARYYAAYRDAAFDGASIPPTICASYSVFGDPSRSLDHAKEILKLVPNQLSVKPGDEVSADINFPFVPKTIYVSLFDETEINLPETFSTTSSKTRDVTVRGIVPQGYDQEYIGIRVFAYSESGQTATGTIRTSVTKPRLIFIEPTSGLRAGSPAQFDMRITGNIDVRGIKALITQLPGYKKIYDSTLAIQKIGNGLWRSEPILGDTIKNGLLVSVAAVVLGGSVQSQAEKYFIVEGGADPSAVKVTPEELARDRYSQPSELRFGALINETIGFKPTNEGGKLKFNFYNWGDIPLENGLIKVSISNKMFGTNVLQNHSFPSTLTDTLWFEGRVSVKAHDSTAVELPMYYDIPPVERSVQVRFVQEDTLYNNTLTYNDSASHTINICGMGFTPELGFTKNGILPDKFLIRHFGNIELPTKQAKQNGITTASVKQELPPTQQKWKMLIMGNSTMNAPVLIVKTEPEANANVEGVLSLQIYKPDSSFNIAKIVRYEPTTKLWQAFETTRNTSTGVLTAKVPLNGIFGVASDADTKGPTIRFNVGGQAYTKGIPIPARPEIGVLITDQSGINTDLSKTKVLVDGKPLRFTQESVMLDSTITTNATNIKFTPEFAFGEHKVCIEASDRIGNSSSICETFQVDEETKLEMLGTFPNPFDKEMFFAFELKGGVPATSAELNLYTTAGRLIKSFKFPTYEPVKSVTGFDKGGTGLPTALGYHEIWWNGKDEDGVQVPNGVYFYRLRLEVNDETLEQKGAIARIKNGSR